MQTLQILLYFLVGIFSAGCMLRLIILFISMALETGDKSGYKQQIKHIFIVLIISLCITGSGALIKIVQNYFV